jgi:branched-chain amino acid transport system substrate-binding protein
VLADAINRAGSTKPEAVQAALQKTDLKANQLMMGYQGVKFDATGQNILASAYMIQLIGKDYIPVYPESAAQAKPIIPFKGWK